MKWLILIGVLMLVGCEIDRTPKEGVTFVPIEEKQKEEVVKEWFVDKEETREKVIELYPYEYQSIDLLEEYDISETLPDRYKMNISKVKIVEVKEPYPCIFNCPTNTSLNGCEYGTCHRPHPKENVFVEGGIIKNKYEKKLVVNVRYRYTRWELSR